MISGCVSGSVGGGCVSGSVGGGCVGVSGRRLCQGQWEEAVCRGQWEESCLSVSDAYRWANVSYSTPRCFWYGVITPTRYSRSWGSCRSR